MGKGRVRPVQGTGRGVELDGGRGYKKRKEKGREEGKMEREREVIKMGMKGKLCVAVKKK